MTVKQIGAFIESHRTAGTLGTIRGSAQGLQVDIVRLGFGKRKDTFTRIFSEADLWTDRSGEHFIIERKAKS
jgi:hypothetical protein